MKQVNVCLSLSLTSPSTVCGKPACQPTAKLAITVMREWRLRSGRQPVPEHPAVSKQITVN
jgi:hypothetical protein